MAGAVLLFGAAGPDVLGELADVDGELDDDEQPATEARTISAAAVPRIPFLERLTLGNTPWLLSRGAWPGWFFTAAAFGDGSRHHGPFGKKRK